MQQEKIEYRIWGYKSLIFRFIMFNISFFHSGLYLQWLCVLLLLWTVLMVPDQTRDEGKTPSCHSVQQQANLKITIVFLTFIIFTVHSLKRSLSLSDHVMSVLKTKTCLFCGCNHSFWSSPHTHWPEISPSTWHCSGMCFTYCWCTALIQDVRNSEQRIHLSKMQIWDFNVATCLVTPF